MKFILTGGEVIELDISEKCIPLVEHAMEIAYELGHKGGYNNGFGDGCQNEYGEPGD